MSRLQQRLAAIAAKEAQSKGLTHFLGEAGDAFELAARCALGAYQARQRRPDESDVFRLGYLTACKELAVVLRAMRRGGPPAPAELEQARREAVEELAMQGNGAAAERAQIMPEKLAELNRVVGHTPPAQFIAEQRAQELEGALVDIIATEDGTGTDTEKLERIAEMARAALHGDDEEPTP